MKRTLISMIFCVPMLALASEQDCSPAVQVPGPADALMPVTHEAEPAAGPAAATALAPVTDLALDAEATAATLAPEAVEATAATLGGVASPQPCVAVAPAPAVEPAYVPKTEHDNSPWRFDMNQNGKRMTADEFDAWMKAKGIRVATGAPVPAAAPVPAVVVASAAGVPAAPATDAQPAAAAAAATALPAAATGEAPALVPVADMVPPPAAE